MKLQDYPWFHLPLVRGISFEVVQQWSELVMLVVLAAQASHLVTLPVRVAVSDRRPGDEAVVHLQHAASIYCHNFFTISLATNQINRQDS